MASTTTPKQMTAADTCRRVAAIRAIASEDPNLPYSEPLASVLAGSDDIAFVRRMQDKNPDKKSVSAVVLRAMLLDRMLLKECQKHNDNTNNNNTQQIVILGAGMDTRAARLKPAGTIRWFEVDQEEVVVLKEKILSEHGKKELTANNNSGSSVVRLKLDLAVDLEQLFPSLEANGFDRTLPTIFLLEGLLYYIPLDGVTKMLKALTTVANSKVLLTMIDHTMLQFVLDAATAEDTSEQMRPFYVNCSKIWKSDLSDITSNKEVLGAWKIQEQIEIGDDECVQRIFPGWTVARGLLKGSERILRLEQAVLG